MLGTLQFKNFKLQNSAVQSNFTIAAIHADCKQEQCRSGTCITCTPSQDQCQPPLKITSGLNQRQRPIQIHKPVSTHFSNAYEPSSGPQKIQGKCCTAAHMHLQLAGKQPYRLLHQRWIFSTILSISDKTRSSIGCPCASASTSAIISGSRRISTCEVAVGEPLTANHHLHQGGSIPSPMHVRTACRHKRLGDMRPSTADLGGFLKWRTLSIPRQASHVKQQGSTPEGVCPGG